MKIKLKDEEAKRYAKLYQGSKEDYKEAEILDVSLAFTYFVKFSNGKFANVPRSYVEEIIEELTEADVINLLCD
jgi:phosphosulfolactate synthase (CoM biosynthesis protein A)